MFAAACVGWERSAAAENVDRRLSGVCFSLFWEAAGPVPAYPPRTSGFGCLSARVLRSWGQTLSRCFCPKCWLASTRRGFRGSRDLCSLRAPLCTAFEVHRANEAASSLLLLKLRLLVLKMKNARCQRIGVLAPIQVPRHAKSRPSALQRTLGRVRTCGGSTRGTAARELRVLWRPPGVPQAVVSDRKPRDAVPSELNLV